MKAKNCDECQYLVSDIDTSECLKGHELDFQMPRHMSDVYNGNYGYKRKCEDFKELER